MTAPLSILGLLPSCVYPEFPPIPTRSTNRLVCSAGMGGNSNRAGGLRNWGQEGSQGSHTQTRTGLGKAVWLVIGGLRQQATASGVVP
jgi:hypothetical protein